MTDLDMTDSMGPGKLVRHMQNPSHTYDEYLMCIGLGPSISSVICKNLSYSGPSYPSSPVLINTTLYNQLRLKCVGLLLTIVSLSNIALVIRLESLMEGTVISRTNSFASRKLIFCFSQGSWCNILLFIGIQAIPQDVSIRGGSH